MTQDDKEIVSVLRAALAEKVGQDRYELWFGAATRLTRQPGGLLVEVGSPFLQTWIRTTFRKELEATCAETLGGLATLEFRVDESLAQPETPAILDPSAGTAAGDAVAALKQSELAFAEGGSSAPVAKSAGVRARKFARLQSFVVGPCNRLAYAAMQMALERAGQVSPVYLYGPTGVGKTHLLEGLWSEIRQVRRDCRAVYLSAEQFTTLFLDALHRTGLPSFRSKYRAVDVLLIDDLHFFQGKKATLLELQSTIDTLQRAGKQLIFAADRPPHELPGVESELSSRLSGGLVCGLEAPDHQTRLGILRNLVRERQLALGEEVLEFIAGNLTTHARELSGALNRIQAASLAWQKPISKALAEDALGELIRGGRNVALTDIEQAVCKTLGLEPASLQSDRKAKSISYPRMLAMWLARKHTRAALSEIGHFFGGRSHSTVISASKTVSHWMSEQAKVPLADQTWPIEDAIRRVEQNLRRA
ncbi:MAG TPA: DnaA/Hda family protein [Pirellulales bacterium]|nr:DnaA/Hda family protein [Pirellulales bacterium]